MKLESVADSIEVILSDVDGVLTDGGIVFDNQGIEAKKFHIRDGLGVKLWQKAGYQFGILTARTSHIVNVRSGELGIDIVRQGFENKLPTALAVLDELGLTPEQACYIVDDLPDIPVIRSFKLGVAVANAAPDVISAADYVTQLEGGSGAVRELIEGLLKGKDRWDDLIRPYLAD